MNTIKALLLSCLAVVLFQSAAFSDVIAERYTRNANNFYIIKDYQKAFQSINSALKIYGRDDIPSETKVLADNIYYDYLNYSFEKKDFTTAEKIETAYLERTEVFSERLRLLIRKFKETREAERVAEEKRIQQLEEQKNREAMEKLKKLDWEEQRIRLQKEEEIKKLDREENRQYLERQEKMTREQTQQEVKVREELNRILQTAFNLKEEDKKKSESFMGMLLISLAVVSGIFIVLLIFFTLLFLYQNRMQLRMFQLLSGHADPSQPASAIENDKPPLLISGQKPVRHQVLTYGLTRNDMLELQKILERCLTLGIQIDTVTQRRNCSRMVAELVYKISQFMGYEPKKCLILYGAALVYDIGFLHIDPERFKKTAWDKLDQDTLKKHTTDFMKDIDFIPKSIKTVFIDAITKHHETPDGKGYPKGLTSDHIPYIAQVIHVAESFEAMTSSRQHTKILDKESALSILKQEKNKYDQKIVNALAQFI